MRGRWCRIATIVEFGSTRVFTTNLTNIWTTLYNPCQLSSAHGSPFANTVGYTSTDTSCPLSIPSLTS